MTRRCPGSGSCAPTARCPRPTASARCWRPRACPSAAPGSTCAFASRTSLAWTMWHQREVRLRPRPRGFHLVTDEVVGAVPELRELRVGLAHLFLRHTSASLTLNENASPDVRRDFAAWFDRAVPDGAEYFVHQLEGPDD